jgi:methionine sulfoxide reductase heme-binding subunit
MIPTASASVGNHLFWIISRGAGTTALVLSSVSVCFGLAMAGRVGRGNATERRAYHEILSLAVMVAIAVHGLTLLGDSYLHPSLLQVTVPFALGHQRVATTLGIIAGWGLICLGLSFYARDRIGRSRWKLIHRFALLAWAMGLVHTLLEGTDAGQLWFIALVVVTSAPVLVLLALRVRSGGARRQLDARLPVSSPAASIRTGRPTIHPGRAH